jgi:hypothetical protein
MTPPNPPTLDLEALEIDELERRMNNVLGGCENADNGFTANVGTLRMLIAAARDLERLKAEAAERDADPQTSAGWWRAKAKGFEAELNAARERIGELEAEHLELHGALLALYLAARALDANAIETRDLTILNVALERAGDVIHNVTAALSPAPAASESEE